MINDGNKVIEQSNTILQNSIRKVQIQTEQVIFHLKIVQNLKNFENFFEVTSPTSEWRPNFYSTTAFVFFPSEFK